MVGSKQKEGIEEIKRVKSLIYNASNANNQVPLTLEVPTALVKII